VGLAIILIRIVISIWGGLKTIGMKDKERSFIMMGRSSKGGFIEG